jgi:hypothetical protein
MSNKSRLQTNNTNLQALIDKANALPDAGGSGGASIETYTGSLSATLAQSLSTFTIVYTDKNLDIQSVTAPSHPFTFEVVKNSMVFIKGGICQAASGCERVGGGSGEYTYKIIANNFSIVSEM